MKKHIERFLSVLLCVAMVTSLFGGLGLTASAAYTGVGGVCFSVTADGNTFTVTRWARSGDLPGQNVIVRTVDLTAFAGIHYERIYTNLTFEPDETTKAVTVTEKTSSEIPNVEDRYQSGTTRAYRFEVLDMDGYLVASTTRTITYSASYKFNNEYILENDGVHLLYIDRESINQSVVYSLSESHVQSVDVNFDNTSAYTTIHDSSGNGYTQGVWTASTNALFSRSGCAPREYLSAVGDKMYASIGFKGKVIDDGWEYIQILGDNDETCDGVDPDGQVNSPSVSLYKACFELDKYKGDSHYYHMAETFGVFPTLYSTEDEYVEAFGDAGHGYPEIIENAIVHEQKYKTADLKATNTGALAVDPTVENLSVRFNARGKNDDDWAFKDMMVRLALVDTQAPTIRGISAPYGLNQKHGHVTIVVKFSEIVKPINQCVLRTSWGDLTAEIPDPTSYANAIAFSGEITADANTHLQVKSITGTIKDLHGRALESFSALNTAATVGTTSTPTLSNGAYQLDSQSDFYWFADQLTTDPSTSAVMTSDINMASAAAGIEPLALNDFTGTFDGGGHALLNLSVKQAGTGNTGLFALMRGTVRDLTLDRSCSVSASTPCFVGGIAGINLGTIEKCVVNGTVYASGAGQDGTGKALGGICGTNASGGTVRSCLVGGTPVKVCISNAWNNMTVGGVVGQNEGPLQSSMFYAGYNDMSKTNITRGAVCGKNVRTITNCVGLQSNANYYSAAVGADNGTSTNVQLLPDSAFFSGEVCYALNGGVTDGTQAWYQTLPETEDLPAFSGATVYRHGLRYANTMAHTWSQSYAWTWDDSIGTYRVTATATCAVGDETYSVEEIAVLTNHKDPTCTYGGQNTYGVTFNANAYGFTEQHKSTTIPAPGHDYSVVFETVAPTCSSEGYTLYMCSRCDDVDDTPRSPFADACAHNLTYSASGNTLTATCRFDPCTMENGSVTLTLNAPAKTEYDDGKSAEATLTGLDAFNLNTGLSLSADGIRYYSGETILLATPTDAGNYTASLIARIGGSCYRITKDYAIDKAYPDCEEPTGLTAIVGDTLEDVVLTNPAGNTPGTWTWDDPTTSVGSAGSNTFPATFTPNDTENYCPVQKDLTVTVSRMTPTYTIPTGLTAKYGDTLADVTLSDGWTWDDPSTSVGIVGEHEFPATFTPSDTETYHPVQANLTVMVEPALIEFGSYPQTEVKDEDLIAALNAQTLDWQSYGYYSGTDWEDGQMAASNYMQYCDLVYGGEKYRGVRFSLYRPERTWFVVDDYGYDSDQYKNGYSADTTYWFRYEPLQWRVLDPSTGLLLCETVIDSQPYNNFILQSENAYYGDAEKTYYANNYAHSSLRQWLNDDFYNTAFTNAQKSKIAERTIDNRAFAPSYSAYDSASTTDKVFLLSYSEALDPAYGFEPGADYYFSSTLGARVSDYAKCQGLSASNHFFWWLRSAGDSSACACFVIGRESYGGVESQSDVSYTSVGVRPAITLDLRETPNVTVPTGLTAKYGDTLADVTLSDGWTWDDPSTSVGELGEHTFPATFTPNDTENYDPLHEDLTVTVEKGYDPDQPGFGALTATYGDTLADLTLPKGWTWDDDLSTPVGSVGEHDFPVTYTPEDTTHYRIVHASALVIVKPFLLTFGSYPQTEVTDENLIAALNAQTLDWQSYGYYSKSDGQIVAWDFMEYCDVIYGGEKYRGVRFSLYRPEATKYGAIPESHPEYYQDKNGYFTNTIYWFRYEPLQWRVLDPDTGLVLCETVIDSQPYNNFMLSADDAYYYGDADHSYYANNYAHSSLRQWLNDNFYNTAFTNAQKSKIAATTLDNSAYSSEYSQYDSASTTDKVFLLSYSDVLNEEYGFESDANYNYSSTLGAQVSDYAKCQGLCVFNGDFCWWLRSAGAYSGLACSVYGDESNGAVFTDIEVDYTAAGVCPAITLEMRETPTYELPTGLTAAVGHELSTVDLPAGWAWDDPTQTVGSVGEGSFAATFTPSDTHNYTTVSVNLAVTGTDDLDAHTWNEGRVTTDPTCTLAGERTYTCTLCSATKTEPVAALGHAYDSAVTEPTCTADGYTTYTCSRCGNTYTDNTVDALGHDLTTVTVDATCTEAGSRTTTCSRCDYKDDEVIPALGHDLTTATVDATCTAAGSKTTTCSRCDYKEVEAIPALGHDLTTATVDATCTEAGSKTTTCSRCDYKEVEEIQALGHDFGEWTTITPATTAVEGLEKRFCSRCDAFEERAIPQLTEEEFTLQDWQSVTIDDQISINFLLNTALHSDMQSITITYVNQDKEVTKTMYVDVNELVPYDGFYKVPAVVAPAQIGDAVTITIVETDGKTTTYETSIAEYCEALIDGDFSTDVKALAAATLEYGRTANDYFAGIGFYAATAITSPYTDAQKAQALADAQALTKTLSATGDASSKITSVSFMALTKPEFRFYTTGLTEAEAVALNRKITVTDSNGEKVQGITARFVKSAQNNDVILLEVKGIEAKDMDKVFTVDMGDFGTVTFSGNDFARMLANYDSTQELGAALYLYGEAAKALFA